MDQVCVQLFEKHGSFCRTGNGKTFALEAFHRDPDVLELLKVEWGGSIVKPPPAAPSRWTWRLYGKKAHALYDLLRLEISEVKRMRGDRKREHCRAAFNSVTEV